EQDPQVETEAVATEPQSAALELGQGENVVWGQTNIRQDGNRFVDGNGNIPNIDPLDIELEGEPTWVVGLPFEDGALWVVTLADGRVKAFSIIKGVVENYPISPSSIPAGMPPLVALQDEDLQVVVPSQDFSPLTHPVLINDAGQLAYIDSNGGLVVESGDDIQKLDINAQPDARILVDENGRLLIHTEPTDRYAHGIMGDKLEAAAIALIETRPELKLVSTIQVPDEFVIEGISPIWADFNGDGEREIIVTFANRVQGAQLVVYNESGELISWGPAIGTGNRWRHQLAVAPFGPNGEMELVDMLTPHIGGPAEFFRWEGDELVKVTEERGYTSHVIFSPNLDMVVAGRFDDSGRVTLIVPTQIRRDLGAIQHWEDGAQTVWTLPLENKLMTNIGAVPLADGTISLGVGLEGGSLRIWQ
ncbi:MAG: VCBS repeat-containing protein, partial [Chloroflexota bacterium]